MPLLKIPLVVFCCFSQYVFDKIPWLTLRLLIFLLNDSFTFMRKHNANDSHNHDVCLKTLGKNKKYWLLQMLRKWHNLFDKCSWLNHVYLHKWDISSQFLYSLGSQFPHVNANFILKWLSFCSLINHFHSS